MSSDIIDDDSDMEVISCPRSEGTMDCKIEFSSKNDVLKITQIANSLTNNEDISKGFLVSEYTERDYAKFLHDSMDEEVNGECVVLVSRFDGDIAGFLIAYDLNYIKNHTKLLQKDSSERRVVEKFGEEVNFLIVKQIGVSSEHAKMGIGKRLYIFLAEYILTRRQADVRENTTKAKRGRSKVEFGSEIVDLFTAVMYEPFNEASFIFHKALSYEPVTVWSSISSNSVETTRVRVVLHTTAQSILSQKISDERERQKTGMVVESSIAHARSLYLHEDRLNWTKLQYLSQYVAALVIGQFALSVGDTLTRSVLYDAIGMAAVLFLGVLAIYLSLAFSIAIGSGLHFMRAHKRSVILQESKMAFRGEKFYPSVTGVPVVSSTVRAISVSRRIFVFLVIGSTILNIVLMSYR